MKSECEESIREIDVKGEHFEGQNALLLPNGKAWGGEEGEGRRKKKITPEMTERGRKGCVAIEKDRFRIAKKERNHLYYSIIFVLGYQSPGPLVSRDVGEGEELPATTAEVGARERRVRRKPPLHWLLLGDETAFHCDLFSQHFDLFIPLGSNELAAVLGLGLCWLCREVGASMRERERAYEKGKSLYVSQWKWFRCSSLEECSLR